MPGYLPSGALPDSLALLPPPPAAGSPDLAHDEAISRNTLALRDTPRWTLAASDADLAFPHAAGTFSCALQAPITQQDTPHLYMLIRKTLKNVSALAQQFGGLNGAAAALGLSDVSALQNAITQFCGS